MLRLTYTPQFSAVRSLVKDTMTNLQQPKTPECRIPMNIIELSFLTIPSPECQSKSLNNTLQKQTAYCRKKYISWALKGWNERCPGDGSISIKYSNVIKREGHSPKNKTQIGPQSVRLWRKSSSPADKFQNETLVVHFNELWVVDQLNPYQ